MALAGPAKSRAALVALILAFAGACGGCGGYAIRGKVVRGEAGNLITFVSPDDPQLGDPGVSGTAISILRDPGRPSEHQVASGVSDASGHFTIPIDEFGAGWMEEVWLIRARQRAFGDAESILQLPGSGQGGLLLIVLSEVPPGSIRERRRDEDYMKDYEKFR